MGRAVGVGMIGLGTVGRGVAELLSSHGALYAARLGRPVELRSVLVRDRARAAAWAGGEGGEVEKGAITDDPERFFAEDVDVVVEVAGGLDPMRGYVARALEAGRHVVTANKSLLAAHGPELFDLARRHQTAIAFEASCAGGIPCVTALQFGLMANRVEALYGILNGTCNYILSQMSAHGQSYEAALAGAQELGYAEADPTLDVSGADAAQKLAILASLAFGCRIAGDDVPCEGVDRLDPVDLALGREMGYAVKLLAIAERAGGGRVNLGVRPCFLRADDLLADVSGPFNALSVYGDALGHSLYYGAGAGQRPTASAVVSDLLNVAAGWYPQAFAQMRLTPDLHEPAELIDPGQLTSRFYLRINAMDRPGTMAQVSAALAQHGISLSAINQHERNAGQYVPVVVLTHEATQGELNAAVADLERLDCIEGRPVVLRIVDLKR